MDKSVESIILNTVQKIEKNTDELKKEFAEFKIKHQNNEHRIENLEKELEKVTKIHTSCQKDNIKKTNFYSEYLDARKKREDAEYEERKKREEEMLRKGKIIKVIKDNIVYVILIGGWIIREVAPHIKNWISQ